MQPAADMVRTSGGSGWVFVMMQFLKSDLLWQLLGGFALGAVIMLSCVAPAERTDAAIRHVEAAIGIHR